MVYQKQKITLPMPAHYHPHDASWIDQRLAYCTDIKERLKVCQAYSDVYQAEHEKEPHKVRKDGKARRAANARLRLFIQKKFRVFQ